VVASYYFGNLSYPLQDQPRLGLLSTVPENADDLLRAAVLAAKQANNNFPGEYQSFRRVVCMSADNHCLHGMKLYLTRLPQEYQLRPTQVLMVDRVRQGPHHLEIPVHCLSHFGPGRLCSSPLHS